MAKNESFEAIERTLKKGAAALRAAGIPFLLGGSLASWARGGPESSKDLDFMIKREDAQRALEALIDAGMKPERPPEDWLVKAWDGDVLVDLIFGPIGLPITDEVIERGDDMDVLAIRLRVMALEDVISTKLLALNEHALDYESLLQMARSLREQVDWDEVRRRTEQSPFAQAFFTMIEALGLADRHDRAQRDGPPVRVARSAGHPSDE